jgi:hypothetical protein
MEKIKMMRQNRAFNRNIRERIIRNNYNRKLIQLFEYVLANAGIEDDDVGLEIPSEYLNQPLDSIFDDVLNQSAKENTLDYINLSLNKKSVPTKNFFV